MENLITLLTAAVKVAQSRDGDVDTIDGAFAAVGLDELISLESEIDKFFCRWANEFPEGDVRGHVVKTLKVEMPDVRTVEGREQMVINNLRKLGL